MPVNCCAVEFYPRIEARLNARQGIVKASAMYIVAAAADLAFTPPATLAGSNAAETRLAGGQ